MKIFLESRKSVFKNSLQSKIQINIQKQKKNKEMNVDITAP